jgi:hypothetical protein
MGMTRNVVPHVYVFTVKGQAPEVRYDDFVEGVMKRDGTFEILIPIAADAPPGRYAAALSCTLDGDQVFSGEEIRFEVTPSDELSATTSSAPAATPNTLVATPTTTGPEPTPADPIEVLPTYTG